MRTILFIYLLFATIMSHAIPAKKIWRTFTQSDGSTLRVLLVGDEHLNYFLTEDKVPLVKRNKDFFYAKNEQGKLVSSGILAHENMQRTAAEKNAISSVEDIETLRQTAPTRHRQLNKLPPVRKDLYKGDRKGLIILVNFSDNTFSMDDPQATYEEIANKKGYNGYEGVGSVHDYFYDQSNGQFNLTFDVVGPITLKHTIAYYGADKDGQNDVNVSEMIVEACRAVKDKVDFRTYDWNNDGEADQVFVLYAGYGQATSGITETIWPHEFNINDKNLVLDGVKINTYACSNELYEYTTGTGIGRKRKILMGIGVICHEFSHCLGLPDFYDTGKTKNYGTGSWDILAGGSYNGPLGIGWVPAGYTSYEKNFAGWLDYTVLGNEAKTVTGMKPLSEGGEAYAIYNPQNDNEYYLFENKGRNKWDAYLPANGLLVLHVDYDEKIWANNMVNNTTYKQYNTHQRLTIVPADGSTANEDRDTYPLGERNSLTNETTPALTLYHPNWDKQHVLYNKVLDIRKDNNGLISFNYLPDPHFTSSNIRLTADSLQPEITEIYNIQGVKIKQNTLKGLPKGIYLVKSADGTSRKIAINQ